MLGMACRFPGCDGPEALWAKIAAGSECVRTLSGEELRANGVPAALLSNPHYVKAGATLDGVSLFDPGFFGLSEREATLMDPQHRLFLECCWEALERTGYPAGSKESVTGVYAGCYLPSYLVHHLGAARHLDAADPTTFHLAETGNDKDYLASRVAYLLGLEGPAMAVQTSCSTGLVAIAEAAEALRSGRCGMALAGASSITFPQGGYLHVDGHIGSRGGHCRTFDEAADGTILGDGVGVVVLRRLKDALAAGDPILAVIKGYAVNNLFASAAAFAAKSTGARIWRLQYSPGFRAASSPSQPPETLHATGMRGVSWRRLSAASARRCAAPVIIGEWKARLSARRRLAMPASAAALSKAAISSSGPETATSRGELIAAIPTLGWSASKVLTAGAPAASASIAPGGASSIAAARTATRLTASSSASTPATAAAAICPRL